MSLIVEDVPSSGSAELGAPPPPGAGVERVRRGTTTIATTAVERLVGWVAASTPGVATAQLTGVRGWLHGEDDGTAPTDIDDRETGLRVAVTVAVTYPEPIADVAAEIRARVTAALHDQLAMTTERVDVTITELRRPSRHRVALPGRVR